MPVRPSRLDPSVRAASAWTVAAVAAGALLVGCTTTGPSPDPSSSAPSEAAPSPTPSPTGPPLLDFPFAPSASTTPLPNDCRAILTESVLAELGDTPLNAPGMGGGIRPDSTRVCAWGEPGAAATWLVTLIGFSPYREASDALYELGREGYTCYEPEGGIRCERTWEHESLPVTQGRTLYYRDGIIIDTQYSNLAPTGYTAAIIDAMWPDSGVRRYTPTPSSTPTP